MLDGEQRRQHQRQQDACTHPGILPSGLDNLTHTLIGITLVRAGVGRGAAGATAAMIVASNAPDVDIVTAFTGGSMAYLAAHRGWTHGLLGVLLLALATWIGALAWRRSSRRTPPLTSRDALRLALVCAVGTALHVVMDLPTSYGTARVAR